MAMDDLSHCLNLMMTFLLEASSANFHVGSLQDIGEGVMEVIQ